MEYSADPGNIFAFFCGWNEARIRFARGGLYTMQPPRQPKPPGQ
ncbi:hypothetical protein [Desulfocicer vacuolatum]|nr:hypothetical protein [Desulfocicer vacuolatum]